MFILLKIYFFYRYSLKTADDPSLSELFEVDSTTGEVVTLAKLDRETSDNYDLVVQATDEGALHTTETLIRVKVYKILSKNILSTMHSTLFSYWYT